MQVGLVPTKLQLLTIQWGMMNWRPEPGHQILKCLEIIFKPPIITKSYCLLVSKASRLLSLLVDIPLETSKRNAKECHVALDYHISLKYLQPGVIYKSKNPASPFASTFSATSSPPPLISKVAKNLSANDSSACFFFTFDHRNTALLQNHD
jgi:hypothetical protein